MLYVVYCEVYLFMGVDYVVMVYFMCFVGDGGDLNLIVVSVNCIIVYVVNWCGDEELFDVCVEFDV